MTTPPSHDTRCLDALETLYAIELSHLCGQIEAELLGYSVRIAMPEQELVAPRARIPAHLLA